MENARKLIASRRDFNDLAEGEVKYINKYAVFMGYLSMAIKGMGFLVLTWTTVVLLGGFVSMLHKKDFWCLTFITLVQTAGIFDVVLNEKLRCMKNSAIGMIGAVFLGMTGNPNSHRDFVGWSILACALILVQVIVLAAALCPLAIIYMFGILMSAGISLWRLIERDYSMESLNGEASNLEPAMTTLYSLALLQGVIFCYRFVLCHSGEKLAKQMTTTSDTSELEVVYEYLHGIKTGCEKDPSFAKERNLVTHAVDMIGSNSPADCISGVKILCTALCIAERYPEEIARGHHMLMKHLVMSGSSSMHILNKILEVLDSRGLHDRETRNQAAMIVEHLAFNINLEQFPRGIQHISSLIGTFEQYSVAEPFEQDFLYEKYQQDWKLHVTQELPSPDGELGKAYKGLLLKGLGILRKLAAGENNCRVIWNTQDMVSKIMAPVTSDLLNHTTKKHGAWSDIVEASLKVMIELTGSHEEVGSKLRHEISSCEGAINTLWRILNCNNCNDGLKLSAIQILTRLYMDTESTISVDFVLRKESRNSKKEFVRILVGIFTQDNSYSSSIKGYAGAALSAICSCDGISGATVVIQTSGGDAVDSLTKVLVHTENTTCRQVAAEILEHLCTHYTKDDEYHGKLKKAMIDVLPEVIGKILCCGNGTHIKKEAHQGGYAKPETDIENPCDDGLGKEIHFSSPFHAHNNKAKVIGDILTCRDETHNGKEADIHGLATPGTDIENQYDNGYVKGSSSWSSSHPQNNEKDEEKKVLQAVSSVYLVPTLLSLCGTVYNTFPSELGADVVHLFEAFFLNELREKTDLTLENLLLFKAISKMVILMMKHGGNMFTKLEDVESLIGALSSTSEKMLDLDYSMVFSCANGLFAAPLSNLNRRTLSSLVKEMQKNCMPLVPSTYVSV